MLFDLDDYYVRQDTAERVCRSGLGGYGVPIGRCAGDCEVQERLKRRQRWVPEAEERLLVYLGIVCASSRWTRLTRVTDLMSPCVQEAQELPGRHQGQTDGGSGPEHELAALDEFGGLI